MIQACAHVEVQQRSTPTPSQIY
ncbi:unnamed protein product [Spirodela intermedia]|uniref:Uncharacterized protein n=2 Tax=Spirodela intermedia TaxID=51605 RepID=A0A7I8IVH1_SPIIN|nr:unnamed protein product [Spirodela intermedia]CAA6661622.1 unnamed protein product [Spirodela intermedia]CAA7397998.1 unnamed protein product [Spirodela intermedia]